MNSLQSNLWKAEKLAVSIPFPWIAGAGLFYLLFPICIFFASWTRWYIGFPAAMLLMIGFVSLMKNTYHEDRERIEIPVLHFCIIALLLLVWVWTRGIGNFFVSDYDHPWRIAVFRDLIDYPWPVVYPESGNALVYYLFYWLAPALCGKLFGWTAGNIALLLWTYIGVLLTFFLLLHVCQCRTKGEIWTAAILLFGWSGLNTIGGALSQILNINEFQFFVLDCQENWLTSLNNGYSFNFLYRTNSGALIQIYNQTTPLWIATLLTFENRKRPHTFAFIGLCLLPFAPLPFLGLVIIMIVFFGMRLREAVRSRSVAALLKEVFSVPNLTAAICITPVIGMFFACNISVSGEGGGIMLLPLELFDRIRVIGITLFWILEFGVIAALIFPKYKRSYLFYTLIASLVLIPFVEFGKRGGRDFCMNASLPALFLLMVLTIRYLNERVISKELTLRNTAVLVVLTLSMLSPIQDIAGKLDIIGDQHQFPIVNDWIYTFSDKQIGGDTPWVENYIVPGYEETMFFQYIAK